MQRPAGPTAVASTGESHPSGPAMALSALGIVYGDLGTSPL